jgi:diguanylate cyclase (GGDEF)-like protein
MRMRYKSALIGLLASAAVPALCPAFAAAAAPAAPAEGSFGAQVAAAKAAMMSAPDVALEHAKAASATAQSLSGEQAVVADATGKWLQAEALARLNHLDKAKPVAQAALAAVQKSAPGGKLHADLLKSLAMMDATSGQPQTALPMLHQAYELYQKLGEARSQAIVLQNIGSIYSEARDYPRVLRYYEQANEVFSADPALKLAAHNNRGNAYKEMGEYAKAEREYGLALGIARAMESPLLEVRILTNLASSQHLQGKLQRADATASEGLRRATGPAAEWRPYLWGVRAQVAYARGDAATAAQYLEHTFNGVDLKTSSLPYREFHATARYVYEAIGRDKQALRHLDAYKRLDDEAREVAASVNSALLSAKFDAANQEARIARLKAEQAEREMKLAHSEQRLRMITWLTAIGGGAAAAVIAAVLFAFFSARKSRREVHAANLQLTYTSRHDALTGLPNRAYFRELLTAALANENGAGCALLLIDLDRFKMVNDTLGHAAGDELLVMVARRLEAAVGPAGHVGRLGGDEFAIMVPDLRGSLDDLARKIIASVSEPYAIGDGVATVGASVSIAVGPTDGADINTLTQNADLALYQAKEAGRGRHARYERHMREEAQVRRQLEADLRDALANDQLALAYQPIVDARTGKTVAYEALLRWDHPVHGAIPPSVFVPIAEETRLINQVGAWVLRTACAEAVTWPEDVKVAVNVSSLQVEAESLTSTVMQALASTGLTAERLELEMTETVFLRQGASSEATLGRLRNLGVQLALDDFGTGYSSLGYLPRASFSKVKIDRSFVQSASEGCEVSMAVIRSIVALARGLGMEITAEGVETKRETALMKKLGCTQFQGYLTGEPKLSARKIEVAAEPLPKPPRRQNRRAA